ncbi:hypothetical protein U1Q18_033899 [Sarracenia purpurea var. burkii]
MSTFCFELSSPTKPIRTTPQLCLFLLETQGVQATGNYEIPSVETRFGFEFSSEHDLSSESSRASAFARAAAFFALPPPFFLPAPPPSYLLLRPDFANVGDFR